jgi:putative ABC transport system permease protein
MDAIRRDHPQFTQNATAGVMPMKELLIDGVRTRLLTLMGAVAFILLISCANLGNLLLARASTRRREVAIRHALGARPLRLVRQMLTESVLLSVAGGLAGFGLGLVLLDVLLAWLPDNLPRANEIGLDPTVLGFTAAVSVLSGVAFGFFPALQLASRAPMDTVREGARGSGRSRWVRTTLVVSEVALALMLLTGAGLLVRSFAKLLEVNPGFRSDRLLTFSVNVPATVYKTAEQRTAFFEAAAERLRALPGVTAVALATTLPVSPRGNGAWFNMLDRPTPADRTPPSVSYRVVSTNYFSTLGMPLISGRQFTDADRLDGTRAVIVSQAVVRRYWPNVDPIGKQIYLGAPDNRLFPDATVVGVVADVKLTALDNERAEVVYVPHRLMPTMSGFAFALRTSMDPLSVTGAARARLRQLDSNVPIVRVRTMDEVIARSVAPARSSMLLVSLFAALALMLAVIGVFGVLSYTVNQRTTELGIRLALGASASNVKMLVLGQGMMPVAAGVLLGLAGAFALTRFMESLLFGVTPRDPATFAAVSLLLAAIAAVASYVPARRATLVDPVAVLKRE